MDNKTLINDENLENVSGGETMRIDGGWDVRVGGTGSGETAPWRETETEFNPDREGVIWEF